MVMGLQAERARLRRQLRAALANYMKAAERALKQGHRHHAALLLERRAELLRELNRHTEAAASLGRSAELYSEWGAHAKARKVLKQARELGWRPPEPAAVPSHNRKAR